MAFTLNGSSGTPKRRPARRNRPLPIHRSSHPPSSPQSVKATSSTLPRYAARRSGIDRIDPISLSWWTSVTSTFDHLEDVTSSPNCTSQTNWRHKQRPPTHVRHRCDKGYSTWCID